MNAYEVALGALLHDIGKFMLRAMPSSGEPNRVASNSAQPTDPSPGSSGRQPCTANYSVKFINEIIEWLPEGIDRAAVMRLAGGYIHSDDRESRLVAEAEALSEGAEDAGDAAPYDESSLRRARLCSVAAGIGSSGESSRYTFALKPLNDPTALFPVETSAEQDQADAYRKLWETFTGEWKKNRCVEPFRYIARALDVLQRYCWCVPASARGMTDVSLFDHLKSTAAIAVALAGAPEEEVKPFLLVAGDLTGIQKYIFGFKMGAGGLARRLRARSFNVNAFTHSILLRILHRLRLPLTQVILMAGGKFHLLLPNTEEARRCVESVSAEATRWLHGISGGETAAVIASHPCGREELRDFPTALAALHEALREERARAAKPLLIQNGRWEEGAFLFPPMDLRDGLCECCGRQGGHLRKDPDGDEKVICDQCDADEDAGARLLRYRYVAFYEQEPPGGYRTPAGWYRLLHEQQLSTPEARDALLILDVDGGLDQKPVPGDVPVISQVWARHAPKTPDGNLVELKTVAERSHGVAYLGCLKMDVDDLGWMFAHGLRLGGGPGKTSISRVAALSRTLGHFFQHYLEWLLRKQFRDDIYLVYSGGDDILMFGVWNRVFDLARTIREEFRRLTGGNPHWKLSAGVALVQPGVPVLLAAEYAEELLEASKNQQGGDAVPLGFKDLAGPSAVGNGAPAGGSAGGSAKDRMTALGTVLRWPAFNEAMKEAVRLREWLENGVLNTARARRLLWAAGRYRGFQQTRDTGYLDYVPMMVYDLRRNWTERKDSDEEQKKAMREAKAWAAGLVAAPDASGMGRLRFVTEFALYGIRPSGGSREEND